MSKKTKGDSIMKVKIIMKSGKEEKFYTAIASIDNGSIKIFNGMNWEQHFLLETIKEIVITD